MKIGDKVKLIKRRFDSIKMYLDYNDEIYTILQIDGVVVTLDRKLTKNNLSFSTSDRINIYFLKSIRKERKKKLLKLNSCFH